MVEGELDNGEDEEANRLYQFLGQYIVIFQWMDAQLDQILLLAYGQDNWKRTQLKLAEMRNVDKINEVERVVMAPKPFGRRIERPEWTETFTTLLERLRQESRRRNSIVHSQYLFEFVKIGMPPLRSDRRKKDGAADFEQEYLHSERTEAVFNDLAMLAFDLSQARVQLIHWYGAKNTD